MTQSMPSEILIAYLTTVAGLSVVRPAAANGTNWPATRGAQTAETQDRWISVVDLTPKLEGKYMQCQTNNPVTDPDGETVTKPVCQIAVRSESYDVSSLQIRKIACALSPVHRVLVTTNLDEEILFHACCIENAPAWLRQDEKNRRQIWVTTVKLSISGVP